MVLVTGSTGHLGANLVRRLLADGESVRVLVLRQNENSSLDKLDVERVYGDLRDPAACAEAVRRCETIHHCAAKVSTREGNTRYKQEIFSCNVLGTRNLLRAALDAGVARVVVTGSFSAIGQDPSRPSDESLPFNPFEPAPPYVHSKAAVEHECLKAFALGLPVVIAVSCAILGPNDFEPSGMGRTLIDFANGRLWGYVAGGFEFTAARDIVEGHLLAMAKGRPGQKYLFSSQYLTVNDVMTIFETVTGRRRPRLRLPGPVMASLAAAADFALPWLLPRRHRRFTRAAVRFLRSKRRADCSKATNELGYRPTSIVEAVREAYECFVRRGLILPRSKSRLELSTPTTASEPRSLGARS